MSLFFLVLKKEPCMLCHHSFTWEIKILLLRCILLKRTLNFSLEIILLMDHWNNFTGRVRKAGNVLFLCVGKSWYRQVKQLTPKRQWLANLSSVSTLWTFTFLSMSHPKRCYRGDKTDDLDCDHVKIARQQLQLCFIPTICLQNVFSAYVIINEGGKKVPRCSFWK